MDKLTVTTPVPVTRKEAWMAWESALVAMHKEEKQRPHMKKWNKAFYKDINASNSTWWLFAIEAYPNRGEIVVETLQGRRERVSILLYRYKEDPKWKTYKIVKDEVLSARQRALRPDQLTWRWIIGQGMPTIRTVLDSRGFQKLECCGKLFDSMEEIDQFVSGIMD